MKLTEFWPLHVSNQSDVQWALFALLLAIYVSSSILQLIKFASPSVYSQLILWKNKYNQLITPVIRIGKVIVALLAIFWFVNILLNGSELIRNMDPEIFGK